MFQSVAYIFNAFLLLAILGICKGNSKKFLNLLDIILCIDWQLFKLPDLGDGGLPSRHRDVLHLHPLVLIHVGGVVVHHLPLLHVVDTDLDLIKFVQDVNLCQGQGGVAIDLACESQ